MASPSWKISGQYYETCNCAFVCPCVPGQLAVKPTKGDCQFAMAFQIERGTFGNVTLDGLGFLILGYTPGEMGNGNWSVGLLTDARASAEQTAAITAIASGQAGGPISALAPLIGKFLGAESAPMTFTRQGRKWSVKVGNLVDMAASGASGLNPETELRLQNTGHPATDTFTLAHPSHSRIAALGLSWSDTTGKNNGQYAPFSWASA